MKIGFAVATALAAFAITAPASATLIDPASKGVTFSAFDTATQGSLLASSTVTTQGLTFAGDMMVAVYRNTLGTLDFYYQFARTGAGTRASDAIETLTGSSFQGYSVDALFSDLDIDGTGIFRASDNPGDVATAQRNASGSVVGVDFAATNPLADQQISATYVFRTNAMNFNLGTFGAIDGSTVSGDAYQPAAAAVPEASTWAMMLVGFGGMGAALRRRRTAKAWLA